MWSGELTNCGNGAPSAGWDLEYNKVIRSYHGHLSGVFALKIHPTLDVLVTGGRDAVARVRVLLLVLWCSGGVVVDAVECVV